ncbi:MAG: DNA repair protein RecN [bacterium]|nr:DNA repair protein RecN [bacterium]
MLKSFTISNLFLIDYLEIEIVGGFVAVTGESGAGKSMIIRALTLLAGTRGNGAWVRDGCDKGFVEVKFTPPPSICDKLKQLTSESGEEWILRREIRSDGKSRSFINDSPVTLTELSEASTFLLSFSLQEDVGAFRMAARQLSFIDEFAKTDSERNQVEQLYLEWKTLYQALHELSNKSEQSAIQSEWLQREYKELNALAYEAGEQEHLREERDRLRHLETIRSSYQNVVDTLDGEFGSVTQKLNGVCGSLRNAQKWDPRAGEFLERVESTNIELREFINEVTRQLESFDLEPACLEQIEVRLQAIADCERKWHITADAIPQRVQKLQQSLVDSHTLDEQIQNYRVEVEQLRKSYQTSALTLSRKRRSVETDIVVAVKRELPFLGIVNPQFSIQWSERSEPSELGIDEVSFRFSANPDHPPLPLESTISGGELARLELVLLGLADSVDPTVLLLDEIDRGVSGRIASAIGKTLRKLSSNRTVFMVTHLPQVAAAAHTQIAIRKTVSGSRTSIEAVILTAAERIDEIAAMLSGSETGQGAIAGARELLAEYSKG